MDDVLSLLAEIAERTGQVRTLYVLVRFEGEFDAQSALSTDDPGNLAFELATDVLRLRGG